MNIIRKLFSIEWIKIRRRSVFWVVVGVHIMLLAVSLGIQQYMHAVKPTNSPFQLPADWMILIQIGSQAGMLLLLIGVTLLIASETAWRTQRQNVIDGLSRGEYFAGKILIVLLLAGIFWVDIIVVGLIIAPFGGEGSLTWPVLSPIAQQMLPNVLLYLLALGVTAFMCGMLASTSGAALGMILAFVMIQPLISGVMIARGGYLPVISRYLPMDVFSNLVSVGSYDAERLALMNERILSRKMPALLSLHTSQLFTVIYIAVFIGFTWFIFRKRDL
ncbi:MAG: ABC transporter permease [Longimicrobiales bacterium]